MTDRTTELHFSLDVHPLDAIKRAAYRLSDQAAFDISLDGSDARVSVSMKPDVEGTALSQLVDQFKTEVLDADLRMSIAKETEGVRNTILSHVFSKTGLTNGE